MSERHKWAKYEMDDEERPYYNPRFGGNLKEFIRRMVEDEGFTIDSLFPYYDAYAEDGTTNNLLKGDRAIAIDDYETMAYEALNHEHSNIDMSKGDNRQVISIMMTGDEWCDVIPINDWSFKHGQEDVVNRVKQSMRDEIMEDDA